MSHVSNYWDALAPHHAALENNYFELPSLRRIIHDVRPPVLVVGAGQGLIVEELIRKGFQTDGIDLSSEMIRHARRRRGLALIEADAKALPFEKGSYETIIYATGVLDFMGDEDQIRVILNEARRILRPSGKIFVAFYKLSAASEGFLAKLGLLANNVLSVRETLELYRLKPIQTLAWVAQRADVGFVRAGMLSLRAWAFSTMKEKTAAFNMQRIFRNRDDAGSLMNTAPEKQPYRNEPEIRNLFKRLAIPVRQLEASGSCYIAQI
jgi:SAM-dependent methyltransferase